MAVLHKKEEKIQAVLGRLAKKYTDEQFVEMFIKLYSKDWGKIKSAYIKQSQDKEPGTIINMPKPEIYLKQVLANYLNQADAPKTTEVKKEVIAETPAVEAKKAKAPAKKKEAVAEEVTAEPKKKAPAKKKAEVTEETVTELKKAKAPAKKKAEVTEEVPAVEKKIKAAAKKPAAKK
ncbi:hypothetical protein [Pedobacter rhodius]|uniref:Uncharacterized protein n=1 Tax=Pedobacter rhodius TaxID=3004098 RepID=A0ABT4KXL8_9SPHI|nr:hypothetical protein [Pedobacter sp. SJ11]MCZ4223670.1 hypothetical protein [Pedobacter sp. SJ11]